MSTQAENISLINTIIEQIEKIFMITDEKRNLLYSLLSRGMEKGNEKEIQKAKNFYRDEKCLEEIRSTLTENYNDVDDVIEYLKNEIGVKEVIEEGNDTPIIID